MRGDEAPEVSLDFEGREGGLFGRGGGRGGAGEGLLEGLGEAAGRVVGHGDAGVDGHGVLAGGRVGDDAGGEVEVDFFGGGVKNDLIGVFGGEFFVFDFEFDGGFVRGAVGHGKRMGRDGGVTSLQMMGRDGVGMKRAGGWKGQ